jgi:hypothetical protein
MVGLSMGYIKHWYEGTEYFINEFCVKTETLNWTISELANTKEWIEHCVVIFLTLNLQVEFSILWLLHI